MTVSSSPTQIPPPVTAAERRWLARFAWLAMLLTTLPYLVAFLNQGADWVFSGFVFTVEDGNSYIAKMLDGSFGAWLFRTPYTAHPQNGALVYLPYLILGKLASPPNLHLKLVLLYHVVRILAGVLVFFAAYDFLAVFLHKVTTRRWAVVLGTLGGGLGWLAVLAGQKDWLGSLPLDFYSPESFGFLSIFGLPHLALARAFLLWGLAKYLAPLPSQPKAAFMDRPAVHAGLLWFLLAFMQPLTVVIAWGVLSAHLAALAAAGIWRARRGLLVEWRT
ncbi:MAG: hypothetical protein OEZ02_06245, partial [Anaerolineae bacterium]|nr:hypothetical protein [Anaerolineae bacterium]